MGITEKDILDEIIHQEGDTYVNDPADRGGPTKFGITQKTFSIYLGRQATADEVAALQEIDARQIYSKLYIEAPGFRGINSDTLRAFLVDSAVQHGAHKELHGSDVVIRWLQTAVMAKVDGVLGPITTEAVNNSEWRHVYASVFKQRMRYYGAIITNDPKRAPNSQAKWALGWMNRLSDFANGMVI